MFSLRSNNLNPGLSCSFRFCRHGSLQLYKSQNEHFEVNAINAVEADFEHVLYESRAVDAQTDI